LSRGRRCEAARRAGLIRTARPSALAGVWLAIAAIVGSSLSAGASLLGQPAPVLILDHVRLIDGTGAAPRDDMRIVVRGDRIESVQPATGAGLPAGATRIDLTGRVVMPGLIDLHFHIEKDPRLAVRQLANGVTSFRDPGQWIEQFEPLREIMRREHLSGPRMSLAGPHIDGEHPAYPADAYVARDPEEARLAAEHNIADGATALKIYYRLPLASAMAVVRVCQAHNVPCTAHLEIVDARDLLLAGLDGIEHITSFGTSVVPWRRAEQYRQAVLQNNDNRRDGRYALFADADLAGREAQRLYAVLERTRPFLNPTLAVFEVRPGVHREDGKLDSSIDLKGYAAMKQLTLQAFRHGARITLGGHSTVPFAGRGEAPWRELELLVEAGLTPLEALTAATATGAASLRRSEDLGTIQPGKLADLVVLGLGQDPSRDIHAIRSVERVMTGGVWVDVARYRWW
jgi:imidazolonepropionase-like amidohydrolase